MTQLQDTFKFAAGRNNAAGLALLVVQPRGDPKKIFQGIQVGLPRTGGNGKRFNDGLFAGFPYNFLTPDEWVAQLVQFGLSDSVASVECTVRIVDIYSQTYKNYSATLGTPRPTVEVNADMMRYRDVLFPLTRLVGPL